MLCGTYLEGVEEKVTEYFAFQASEGCFEVSKNLEFRIFLDKRKRRFHTVRSILEFGIHVPWFKFLLEEDKG